MTAQRQERNGGNPRGAVSRPGIAFIGLWAALIGAVLAVAAGFSPAVWASTTERVIVNRFSGLAIEGFDPVAYFADGEAEVG